MFSLAFFQLKFVNKLFIYGKYVYIQMAVNIKEVNFMCKDFLDCQKKLLIV